MKILSRPKAFEPRFFSENISIQVDHLPNGEDTTDPKSFFESLRNYLGNSDSKEVLMVVSDPTIQVQAPEQEILKLWEKFDSQIVFSATAHFHYQSEALAYYYWKYYPRQDTLYDFLDSNFFIGRASDLLEMVNDIVEHYDLSGAYAINDLFHRVYVDTQSRHIAANYAILLDHSHKLAGSTDGRVAVFRWFLFSKVHSFLFFEEEKKGLKPDQSSAQNKSRDYREKKSGPFNKKTQTSPAIFIGDLKEERGWPFYALLLSFAAYFRSIGTLLKITFFNKGNSSSEKIFRYSKNKGKELNESISQIMDLLRRKQPFSFSHFNDGEITFIKKYLAKDHKEVWFGGKLFGRFQDQYNKKLGELLVDSFEMQQPNYFVGTPCESCHPRLHDFAKKERKSDPFTIPAMTFHHNLSYYPEILGQIKNRKTYFAINPYQDLSFFKDCGFTIGNDQHIKVPFKNAHNEFDNLKELRFEEGAVVLLMCGMLAKILCAHWYRNQPSVTFIAFGSSFDDFIQENINFRLFPKKHPFSRHIIGSRGYLFGAKPKCEVCFDVSSAK